MTRPALAKAGSRNPLVSASGYLVARRRATLSAKLPGRLAWLGVEEGARVVKGQVLARLEAHDFEAARRYTEADLQQAQADLVRNEALLKAEVVDPVTVDHLRTKVSTLKAQLALGDALLEDMVVRAPFTGTVTQKLSEVGETVSPGTAGGLNATNAIAVLADFDSLEVEVEVSESDIARLFQGMSAEISVDALEGDPRARALRGVLRAVYPTSNRQKAVVLARVGFLERHPLLMPEMGAKVLFLGRPYDRDVLTLGREQVVTTPAGAGVWTLRAGKASFLPVRVVASNPLGLEVEGLAPDTPLLVLPADQKVEAGQAVREQDGP